MNVEDSNVVIKPSMTQVITISLIGIVVLSALVAAPIKYKFLIGTGILLVFGVFVASVLVTKLVLDKDGLTYKTLFSTKQVLYANMQKVDVNLGSTLVSTNKGMERRSYFELNIWDNQKYISSPLVVNMKQFPKTAIVSLASVLSAKAPNLQLGSLANYLRGATPDAGQVK